VNIQDLSQLERNLKSDEEIIIKDNKIFILRKSTKRKIFVDYLTFNLSPINVDNNQPLFKSTSLSGLISLNDVPDDFEKDNKEKKRKKPERRNSFRLIKSLSLAVTQDHKDIIKEEEKKKKRKVGRPKKIVKERIIIPDVVGEYEDKKFYNIDDVMKRIYLCGIEDYSI